MGLATTVQVLFHLLCPSFHADAVPAHPETDRITGITREQNPALSLPSARQNLGGPSDLDRSTQRLSEDLAHYEAQRADIDWLVAEYAMLGEERVREAVEGGER